ncbi:peptidoglycan-binding protein [Streptomyces sp. NPDC059819]|uniref:peptidoglycan-binding protein n=1 Tax=Streptomyces sp. NPDC059819 TaxID=3346963 RepID=UPI00364E2309
MTSDPTDPAAEFAASTPARRRVRRRGSEFQDSGGLRRKRRLLVVVLGGAVALTIAGLTAGAALKSPAQVAAETAAPPLDVLTAKVEKRVLSATVVTRGSVEAAQEVEVSAQGLGRGEAARSVVTKVNVKAGGVVGVGMVLAEVSGRPVFALEGSVPAYRDLVAGAQGQDVTQVQKALASLGYGRGRDTLGIFGPGTQHAISSLYATAGYAAATTLGGKEPTTKEAEETGGGSSKGGKPTTVSPLPRSSGGITLPAAEVVFLAGRQARVESLTASVGADAGSKLMTLSAGSLMVQGTLETYQKGMVRPGQKAQLFSETAGDRAVGTVLSVGPAPAAAGKEAPAGPPKIQVVVKPDSVLPAAMAGQDVRLTIAAASTAAEVLVVPASALSSGADGRTTVLISAPDTAQHRIEVRPGMSGDGYVEVTPTRDQLRPGDQVIVGIATGDHSTGQP